MEKKSTRKKILIAGPCVIEDGMLTMELAFKLNRLAEKYNFEYIFKASFDKANRTSIDSYRGLGMKRGLNILRNIKEAVGCKILTDIHEPWQAKPVAKVVDILQIPAFLCRQTDLLVAAGHTGKTINIKKAQFLDGKNMIHSVQKVRESGNSDIMLTERGSMFGLGNLVVDFRQIIDMKEFGYPVIMDCTHSTQKPSSLGDKSGGERKYAIHLAKLANAIDVDGFFFEVHPDPDNALCDGPNMIQLDNFENILKQIT
jgi:2-dehydro-3-deoxyphosphooctonate aldolase (KDO 8-P synthase)